MVGYAPLLEALQSTELQERNKAALDLRELAEVAVPTSLRVIREFTE
jgi:hypothetical protein